MVAAWTYDQQQKLHRATDALRGCAHELSMAAKCCSIEYFSPAFAAAKRALELWLVASLIADTAWRDCFADLREALDPTLFEEDIVGALSDVEYLARTGLPYESERNPQQWDVFIQERARVIAAVADRFEMEAVS